MRKASPAAPIRAVPRPGAAPHRPSAALCPPEEEEKPAPAPLPSRIRAPRGRTRPPAAAAAPPPRMALSAATWRLTCPGEGGGRPKMAAPRRHGHGASPRSRGRGPAGLAENTAVPLSVLGWFVTFLGTFQPGGKKNKTTSFTSFCLFCFDVPSSQ